MEAIKVVPSQRGSFPVFTGGEFDVLDIKFDERTRKDDRGRKEKYDAMLVQTREGEKTFAQDNVADIILEDGSTVGQHFTGKKILLPASGKMRFPPIVGLSGETNGRKWQIHAHHWDIKPSEIKVVE
jgi:hypothetical protein